MIEKVVEMMINRYGKDRPLTLDHLRIILDITKNLEGIQERAREQEIAVRLNQWDDESPGV